MQVILNKNVLHSRIERCLQVGRIAHMRDALALRLLLALLRADNGGQ